MEREISKEPKLYIIAKQQGESPVKVLADLRAKEGNEIKEYKEVGIFTYETKEKGKRLSMLFLISEVNSDGQMDIIYDDKGDVIAWKSYEEKEKAELQIAQDIELDKNLLNRQLQLEEERTRNSTTTASSNSDTAKAGDERDLPKEQEKDKNEQSESSNLKENEQNEQNELRNLNNDINIGYGPKIRLDQTINGYYLWQILQIEEKLKGRLPEGISEKSFRTGYLTIVDSKELEAKDGKKRQAEDTFVVCTYSGDIIELDEQILEQQYLGTRDERMKQESNRIRYADGKEVAKPDTDIDLTRTSKWRIPDASERFAVNEEWYLGVDVNREWRENGQRPPTGKIKEISFIQESRETDKVYSRDSAEARTRESIEYKLEDVTEPPLSEKENEKMKELQNKDANEAKNVRKEHKEDLKQVVEELTEKYGESYREMIEEGVEEYHKKGEDPEKIKQDVDEELKDIEDDYYRHGRSRKH